MSKVQITFAVITACIAVASLIWTVAWAVRIWRKAGDEVTAELGQGYVDEQGLLQVFFQDGRSKMIRISGDPHGLREKLAEKDEADAEKAEERGEEWKIPERVTEPVNAIFVRNRGRAAVTVARCTYYVDLGPETMLDFEPQPGACLWGDLLPKRIEAGDEIILIHDKEGMWGLLNAAMRDHGVFQTVYWVWLELGNGKEVFVGPPIQTQASMTDEEFETKTKDMLYREPYEAPEYEEQRRLWPLPRRRRSKAIMEEDLHPDDLRAIRGQTESSP